LAIGGLIYFWYANTLKSMRHEGITLSEAVKRNDLHTVRLIIGYKLQDINMRDQLGRTALHYAVIANNLPAAEILLKAGANTSIADTQDLTPIKYAITQDMINIFLRSPFSDWPWAPEEFSKQVAEQEYLDQLKAQQEQKRQQQFRP
jgi:hypothetical protein